MVAAVGDVHGQHHAMVDLVERAADAAGVRPDVVLQVGDFEPHRHEADVATMAAPSRYRKVGSFPDFHQGRARFPCPVVFIGGNHEPYGFLEHHRDGAELAPGCRYLGRAGMLEHGGLRIAGLSGIWRQDTWLAGRPSVAVIERTKKKRYTGFTPADIDHLLEICEKAPPHVLLLHEWPRLVLGPAERTQLRAFFHRLGVHDTKGDEDLPDLRRVQAEIGSEFARELVQLLEPQLVLCGHVHAPLRTTVHDGATSIPVRALANVSMGADAIALFRWTTQAGFEEMR